jgi:formylmethanofuran dehydrogenase subunit E
MCEMKTVYCFECGEELKDHDVTYEIGNGEFICESCRDNYYYCCDDCYDLIHVDDIVTVDYNDRYVCESCADAYYVCDHCNNLFSDRHIAINTIQITLCDYCYNEYYFTCAGCGEVYHQDNGEYINGHDYCSTCADDHRHCILSYSTKPNPIFFGGSKSGYGLEVEIDDGDDKQNAARDIQAAGDDHIYLKEDGSLSYKGMEIVTHPATLDYHVNHFPWADICRTALSYGYRSHDTDTCGLHIHASRSLFGDTEMERDLTIAKVILLIDRWYDSYIVNFARRDLSKMQQWADKPNADIKPEDSDRAAVHKSKKTANSRYKAVNLCNYSTVEFRFFRGTLKRDTIIASIQWTDTLIKYCRKTPLKDLFNATWDDIFSNTEHKELTSYLKQRNLYERKEVM